MDRRGTETRAANDGNGDPLGRRLRGLTRPSYREHDARVDRLTVAYRGRRQGLGVGPMPLSELRLVALSYRWGQGRGREPRPRALLATYRPVVDTADGVRVSFACADVRDAARCGLAAEDPESALAAATLHEAAQDAEPWEWLEELPQPRLYAAFEPSRSPAEGAFADASDWSLAVEIEGLRAWPLDRIAGLAIPSMLYADLGHLRGGRARNPAFPVLRGLGVIAAPGDYGPWSRSFDASSGGDPDSHEAVSIRRSVEAYCSSAPHRESSLRRALGLACADAGVPLLGGIGGELATSLLRSPWGWCDAPSRCRALPLALSAPAGPGVATFAGGLVEADLGALGPFESRYQTMSHASVASSLSKVRYRGRRPRAS